MIDIASPSLITHPQPPSHGNQKISPARQQCASHSNTKDDAKFNTVMKYLNIDLHTSQMRRYIIHFFFTKAACQRDAIKFKVNQGFIKKVLVHIDVYVSDLT